ncbi:MAG TPA: LPS assembly protein LptD [Thermodesulfobacteriota bacterium]
MSFRKSFTIALLLAVLALWGRAWAQEPTGDLFSKDAPIEVTADTITYDKETDSYHATGNVEITQEGTTMKADSAILNMTSGVATASGNLQVVDEGGSTLSGKSFQFNIKEKTAVLVNGRLYYREDNVHLTADTILKTGPETYNAERVTYTTCDCPPEEEPAWSFAATSAKVMVGDFLTGWNARFYIKGVPVLYAPFISIPIKRDRQTGFLQPRPGFSELRGFVLENSLFWATAKNQDATFYLDIESKRGLGKGIEYRYIRSAESFGELFLYHFQEKSIERVREFRDGVDNLSRPEEAENSRWRLKYQHSELLPGSVSLRANLDIVSDDEYFIDFGRNSAERSLESIESNLSATKSWSNWSLVGQLRVFDNLLDADDEETLQRLPEVTLTGTDSKLYNTPLYLSSVSSYVNFWREEGLRGQRLDVRPRLSLPMSPGGYFDFIPSVGPMATLWYVEGAADDKSYYDRFLYDLRAELRTTFVRVYRTDLETLKAVRHTIRPNVTYVYVPEAVQDDLPNFDALDRLAPQNSLSYSLNSTLTGKHREGENVWYFDYLYLDLSQSYNLYEAQRELTSPGDERKPFSEITGEIVVRPSPRVTATAKGKFDPYESRFNTYDISLAAADRRGDTISIAHRYVRDGANYIEGFLRARLTGGVNFTYLQRYSFDEYRSLESAYGIEYAHQCWSATLTYTERLEEKIVYLTFNLLGLGKVAGIQGSIAE